METTETPAAQGAAVFTPELGQAAFGNTAWHNVETQTHVEEGLGLLASLIGEVRGNDAYGSLVSNTGAEAWEGEVFAMRSYCWCDGGIAGHEDGCPPNFEHRPSGLVVTWYKHVGRGSSQNRAVSVREWVEVLGTCIREVLAVPASDPSN